MKNKNNNSKFEEWFTDFSHPNMDLDSYQVLIKCGWNACKNEVLKMLKESYPEDFDSLEITERIKKEL